MSVSEVLYKESNVFRIVYRKCTTVVLELKLSDEAISEHGDIENIKSSAKIAVNFVKLQGLQPSLDHELIVRKVLAGVCKFSTEITYFCFEDIDMLFALEALREILLYAKLATREQICLEWGPTRKIRVDQNIIYQETMNF